MGNNISGPSSSGPPGPSQSTSSSPETCPVDPAARAAWLSKSRDNPSSAPPSISPTLPSSSSCSSTPSSSSSPPPAPAHAALTSRKLSTERETSTIPRSTDPDSAPLNIDQRPQPQIQQGSSLASPAGNWVYPSEQMFFAALRRKNFTGAQEADMRAIVPIHNAVNERAWREILQWERGQGADACGGPRLHSFSGDSTALTPKARFNSLLGYTAPFDRHDWVVDRCGTRVEYVIDFYKGKDTPEASGLSFYLDVRPKLNTWQGWKMRLQKAVGL
ncbi:MAG: hypothetical protein M1825_003379 [Sarcosagium campestre]|nr:MAG: hypothetical protein M1825_003379 [Sarcosagium campestre]